MSGQLELKVSPRYNSELALTLSHQRTELLELGSTGSFPPSVEGAPEENDPPSAIWVFWIVFKRLRQGPPVAASCLMKDAGKVHECPQ